MHWAVPGGEFAVAVDGISAIFLLPIFLIPMLGANLWTELLAAV